MFDTLRKGKVEEAMLMLCNAGEDPHAHLTEVLLDTCDPAVRALLLEIKPPLLSASATNASLQKFSRLFGQTHPNASFDRALENLASEAETQDFHRPMALTHSSQLYELVKDLLTDPRNEDAHDESASEAINLERVCAQLVDTPKGWSAVVPAWRMSIPLSSSYGYMQVRVGLYVNPFLGISTTA